MNPLNHIPEARLQELAMRQNMNPNEYLAEFFYSESAAKGYLGGEIPERVARYTFEGRNGRSFYLRTAIERVRT